MLKANKELGRKEAKYYDQIHSEIFNKYEQYRLKERLKQAASKISSKGDKALDIGAGTGNVSCKLVDLGFDVTAVDLCPEYLDILKKKCPKARIIRKEIDKVDFEEESFDMITTYSVLHHFPDYLSVISKAVKWLKKGGILYLDHEVAYSDDSSFYRFTNGVLNVIKVCWLGGIKRADIKFDYSHADYHKVIDHLEIGRMLKTKMRLVKRRDYFLRSTHYWNPLSLIYKLFNKRDTVLWVGKK